MKYKNTKTGAIIETSTRVSGENWKPEIDEEPEKKKRHLKTRGLEKINHKRVQNNGAICYVRRYIYSVART